MISVPKPTKRADGLFTARMMVHGQRIWVEPQPTEAKYYAAARAMKADMIDAAKTYEKITLREACERYIEEKSGSLSPSTIYGYQRVPDCRFKKYMDKDIHVINYQKMIDDEKDLINSKTMKSNWGFVKSVLKFFDVHVPNVVLPQIYADEQPWLNESQIKDFLKAIEGMSCEIGALLGLHSLRRSEILSITPSKIYDGYIHVEGSTVMGVGGMVSKATNKNVTSRRVIPIMIPRLQYLVDTLDWPEDKPYIYGSGATLYNQINDACERANLPKVGVHGLRRSFASLAHSLGWDEKTCMKYGGWSNNQTMHAIYIKLQPRVNEADIEAMKAYYSD